MLEAAAMPTGAVNVAASVANAVDVARNRSRPASATK